MLDEAARRGAIDLMAEFALPLPLSVISEMLGIPEEWRLSFHHQVVRLIEVNDKPVRRAIRWLPAMPRLLRFFEDLLELKRREPDDKLITRLIAVEEAGDHLSRDELIGMIFLLLFAGHETSVNLIGNGLMALLDHPRPDGQAAGRPELDRRHRRGVLPLHEPGRARDAPLRARGRRYRGARPSARARWSSPS